MAHTGRYIPAVAALQSGAWRVLAAVAGTGAGLMAYAIAVTIRGMICAVACCLTAQVGLGGELRPVGNIERRISEAAKVCAPCWLGGGGDACPPSHASLTEPLMLGSVNASWRRVQHAVLCLLPAAASLLALCLADSLTPPSPLL